MSNSWVDAINDMPERDAERAVIAAIMLDSSSISAAMESLEQKHFADPFLGEAFHLAYEMFQRGESTDVVTLGGALTDAGHQRAGDEILEISMWSNQTNVYPWFMAEYAQRVLRLSRVREFQSEAPRKLGKLLQNPGLDPIDVLSEWMNEVEIGYRKDDPGPRPLETMMSDVGQMIDDKRAGVIVDDQTPTPWAQLSRVLGGGIRPGEVCVVAGRPGSGKTVVGAQMLFEASMHGTAIMFSAEMTHDTVVQRMVSCETGIPFSKIQNPQLMTDQQYDMMRSYMDSLSALPVYIDDLSGITTDQIMARTQALQRQGKISLVVFDYLELAGDEGGGKNEESRISKIAKALKHIARRLDVPVVVLAQLSREVERRNPPIPKLSDLRSSGMIEQVADKVVMLYRPEYYVQQNMLEPNPEEEHLIEFYIHKNRNGENGKVGLRYDGPVFRISEEELYQPYNQEAMFS